MLSQSMSARPLLAKATFAPFEGETVYYSRIMFEACSFHFRPNSQIYRTIRTLAKFGSKFCSGRSWMVRTWSNIDTDSSRQFELRSHLSKNICSISNNKFEQNIRPCLHVFTNNAYHTNRSPLSFRSTFRVL